ncbi:endoglucanase [Hahella sp. CCB-MM4]|uniref:carbohydrate-binding protein n=1 Tax=Hahella sp. (strain CCB-MM4) TaxID=1926491 RepID=UPI000B9C1236|nr:carbohydrate-binding protein [Hahella sp. CCB-MM4]OZG71133.1 endoglucanase [Hahella sp. CCB-MM4]
MNNRTEDKPTKLILEGVLKKYRRKILRRNESVFICCVLFGCATTVYAVPPLSVQGNKVVSGGQQVSLGGNSLFWSNNGWGGERFYNSGAVGAIRNDWNASIVRAAMGVDENGGYLQDKEGNRNRVITAVDAAIANDMYVIIDWHSHRAHQYQNEAIAFFQDMAHRYGDKNNVIYEIYNEPLDVSWSGTIKPYAEAVIDAIRQIDPDNLIIVGTRNWSQEVEEASWDPIQRNNIAYTLHFYAGTHKQWLRDKAVNAMNNGIALFVTEWGTVDASGDGSVNEGETWAWVDFMRDHGLSHANWALNDKAEGASTFWPGVSATGGWNDGDLTPSGKLVKSIIESSDPIPGNSPDPDCAAVLIPAKVQAENYCEMEGIQKEDTSDTGGGQNLGYIDSGDWMTYKVNVPRDGLYTISYRVASLNGGGILQAERAGGSPVYGSIEIPSTGGWQNWITMSHTVQLSAGEQRLGLAAVTGGFNINWFNVTEEGAPAPDAITMQAEDYLVMSGVQLEDTTDVGGGQNVGYIDANDWMSYPEVDIPESGTYTVEYRVASLYGGGMLQFEKAGGDIVYGSVNVPNTGGWQNWTTIKHQVTLEAGRQRFGIYAPAGGWNLNWFKITKGTK